MNFNNIKSLTMKSTVVNTEKVTRVEVIDENGRSYVNWKEDNKIMIQVQDDGRTLKIFITQDGTK